MNALKHGAYSAAILVLGETQVELDHLRAEMVTTLLPEGPLETRFVDRMVLQWWRLERAQKVERETLEGCLAEARYQASDFFSDLGGGVQFDLPKPMPEKEGPSQTAFHWQEGAKLERILRYEGQVERRFFALLRELENLQARRRACEFQCLPTIGLQFGGAGHEFVSAGPILQG